MIVLRQFHSLENETITIKVPPEFKQYQQAEIIILPIENTPRYRGFYQTICRCNT